VRAEYVVQQPPHDSGAACDNSGVRTLRIFISSTFTDLLDYRQAASEAIRGLDHKSDDMIDWSADDRNATNYSIDRVRQSDALILLVAHRYGEVPEGEQYSVTELEYRAARAANVPVFAFFVDPKVPWPPEHMDWDSRERLQEFKQLVQREVTRKQFRSAPELALGVTQALAHLLSRPVPSTAPRRFAGDPSTVRTVSTASRLLSEPDVLVPIGTAEDDLPLLLEVSRSRDLSYPLDLVAGAVSSPNRPPPDELLETFRQSLAEYATASWAEQGLAAVNLRSGDQRRMYVTPFPLVAPFRSILAKCLNVGVGQAVRGLNYDHGYGKTMGTIPQSRLDTHQYELQSTGGRNRFLAVDPDDGTTYSVGFRHAELVEWRPFLCESVAPLLPGTTLDVDGQKYDLDDAATALTQSRSATNERMEDGRLRALAVLTVRRQELMALLCDVADQLGMGHAHGVVHGDVKPDNVLVLKTGIQLIDAFGVKFGEQLPGWTPSWSAPEQVRGEPVTGAADVYPLALMAARILGGEVVGEVRKYRTPAALQMPEVDLFHNPSLYIDRDKRLVSSDGIRAWRDLVERSLSFDPERRPASASDFADEMRALFDAYPIADTVTLSPTGDLVASRLVDGSEAVAHLVSVDQPSPSGQPSYGPPASYGQPASYGGFVPPFSPTGTDYPTYTG